MIASVLDWAAERFQDALGGADLDPGLVHRKPFDPARRRARIEEFIQLLFGGIAAEGAAPPAARTSPEPAAERARPGRERVRA